MPVPASAIAEVVRINRNLANRTAAELLRIWDSLESWTPADADAFHAAAQPFVRDAATASRDFTEDFASLITPDPAPVPSLVVDDAAARLYDPFDRFGHLVSDGTSWPDAANQARSVVATLGRDTVYRTTRTALSFAVDLGPDGGEWKRRLGPNSCDWCIRISRHTWPSAAEASFGHDNCNCIPIPADSIGDHNDKVLEQRMEQGDFADSQAKHDQRKFLRRQAATARKNRQRALDEGLFEPDPVRRERLSIREQEWETRAEMAEERLRILMTGSHRIAA